MTLNSLFSGLPVFGDLFIELLFSLQVVLQSELAAFRRGDKLLPLYLRLHKRGLPGQSRLTGMWSNLVLANPSENGNMYCQNYWSIQLLRGVQQATDRF